MVGVIPPNDANGKANSEDSDQTALEEQSDLGLHCLHRTVCPKIKDPYSIFRYIPAHMLSRMANY